MFVYELWCQGPIFTRKIFIIEIKDIKHKGKIIVKLKEENNTLKLSIADNGIGIDKKFHDKIFKIFHVLNKSKDSTGIGLSIVKKIVNLHKGEIWIKSEPKKGTTFFFTLKK